MKKSTFNRLLSVFLMVMAVIFGVNGQVIMAEAALPDGGTTESGHAAEAGGATAADDAGNGGAEHFRHICGEIHAKSENGDEYRRDVGVGENHIISDHQQDEHGNAAHHGNI